MARGMWWKCSWMASSRARCEISPDVFHLEPLAAIPLKKWVFGYQLDDDSKSLHRKWLEMKQTSNKKWLFGVPGTSSWIFLVENFTVQRGFLIDVFWLKGEQLCVRILIVVEGIYLGCGPLTVTVVNEGL